MEIKPRQGSLLFDLFRLAGYHHREAEQKVVNLYCGLRIPEKYRNCICHNMVSQNKAPFLNLRNGAFVKSIFAPQGIIF
jgi:hypothetical protein